MMAEDDSKEDGIHDDGMMTSYDYLKTMNDDFR